MRGRVDYPRLPWLGLALLAGLGVVATRVVLLSARPPSSARAASWEPSTEVLPQRGSFWDRRGRLIATASYDRYEVILEKDKLPDPASFLAAAAPYLGARADFARLQLDNPAVQWVTLFTYAMPADAEAVKALAPDGAIVVRPLPSRHYALGEAAGHLTGFVDADGHGEYGLEAQYQEILTGALGHTPGPFGTDPRAYVPPRDGADLVLTIDRDIQMATWRILADHIGKQDATGGTVIVLEPSTGDILASVSYPGYDPNNFGAADVNRYIDPAIGAYYPPGSVLKPISLAAAIDGGVLSPDSTYDDTGTVFVHGVTIPNQDYVAHGPSTMWQMLQLSLNVGAVHVADTLGSTAFYRGLDAFGLGHATGIDEAGEAPGSIVQPGADGWVASNFAYNAFGQGMDVTPMQMAAAIATLANDGRRMTPRLVRQVRPDGADPQDLPPRTAGQIVSAATARTLRTMMESVVESTAKAAELSRYTSGGKTGTSELPDSDGDGEKDLIASFCGFFPVSQPRAVILVKLDRPTGELGSRVAAPIFAEVAEVVADALGVRADKAGANQ
ncbi:MAG: penicillin-binding protein 2 [Ardenticatenales bacterium]